MFYYLEGKVVIIDKSLAVIDIGGAGYALYVTAQTLSRLTIGEKARLYTYCNIKEDAFDIFGFYDYGEKRCFEQLISVSGVGPKAALSILSYCTPGSLAFAIIGDDERVLTAAPGVGKKLAQRIILELKDKVSKEELALKQSGFVPPSAGGGAGSKAQEAAAALAVLGYTQSEISVSMRAIDTEGLTVEEIVKKVLAASL